MELSIVKHQIIDENMIYNAQTVKILNEMQELRKQCSGYKVLSVIGNQSTGKSTILNCLFNCNFDVLDSSKGRKQTTKGIWLGIIPRYDIMILDVEGFDSDERLDNKNSVGTFMGSNLERLTTIFEMNFKLFQAQGKDVETKKILFLFRDFDSKIENFKVLCEKLMTSVNKIWNEIRKPVGFDKMKPEEFFDISFEHLPSYIHQKEEFLSSLIKLKSKILDETNDAYFFKSSKKKSLIPLDSLDLYASKLWKMILECEDINIPSEKKLISIERCSQIKYNIFNKLIDDLKDIDKIVSTQIYADLASKSDKIILNSMQEFDQRTYFYDQEIAERMKLELKDKLNDNLVLLLRRQLEKIKKYMKMRLEQCLKDINIDVIHIQECALKSKNSLEMEILDMIERSKAKELEYNLQIEKEYVVNKLNDKYIAHIEKLIDDYIQSFYSNKIELQIIEKIKTLKDNVKLNFWDEFTKHYETLIQKSSQEFKEILRMRFQLDDVKIQEKWLGLKEKAQKAVQKGIQDFAMNYLEIYITKIFDYKFNHNHGRVEIWKTASTEYLEKKFESTFEYCKGIILLFEVYEIPDPEKEKDKKKDQTNFMIVQQNTETSIAFLNAHQIKCYEEILVQYAKKAYEIALRECKSKGIFENLFYEVIPAFVDQKLSKLKRT